jgi:hypothetical protein
MLPTVTGMRGAYHCTQLLVRMGSHVLYPPHVWAPKCDPILASQAARIEASQDIEKIRLLNIYDLTLYFILKISLSIFFSIANTQRLFSP